MGRLGETDEVLSKSQSINIPNTELYVQKFFNYIFFFRLGEETSLLHYQTNAKSEMKSLTLKAKTLIVCCLVVLLNALWGSNRLLWSSCGMISMEKLQEHRNLLQGHFNHHESDKKSSGIEPEKLVCDWLSCGTNNVKHVSQL